MHARPIPFYNNSPGVAGHAGGASTPHAAAAAAVDSDANDNMTSEDILLELGDLLLDKGIEVDDLSFGTHRAICPECNGGSSNEKSFAVTLYEEGVALFICHRATCEYTGRVVANITGNHGGQRSSLPYVSRPKVRVLEGVRTQQHAFCWHTAA